jgi:hypothetical protein
MWTSGVLTLLEQAGSIERQEGIVTVTSETTRDHNVLLHRIRGTALTEVTVALGVGTVGVLAALAGVIAFVIRVKLAELFLGAHVWFETPVTDVDAVKVLLVTIQTLELFAWGAFTAAVAFIFAFAKWTQTQASVRTQPS